MIRVGIVESNLDILEGKSLQIEASRDHELVYTATDALKAVADFEDLLVDVMLVSQRLQGTSGVNLIEKLASQSFELAAPTRFILTAPFATDGLLEAALLAGAHGLVTGEENPDALVSAINRVAKGKCLLTFEKLKHLAEPIRMTEAEQIKLTVAIEGISKAHRKLLVLLLDGFELAEAQSRLELTEYRVRKLVDELLRVTETSTIWQMLLRIMAGGVKVGG